MRRKQEQGQVVILLLVALAIFLIGAMGLALDGANLYGHWQMAQGAADATAIAGIMSIFNGTNVGANSFGTASHTCAPSDPITPCKYAAANGFGSDLVVLDFGDNTNAPEGLSTTLSGDTPSWMKVTVTRNVQNSFIRMLGAGPTTPVTTTAVAGIVLIESPVPILITHPDLPHSLSTNGTTNIQICGGPPKSIQVNSKDPLAYAGPKAGGLIDLIHAGPPDPGNCSSGTGSDFGVLGGSTTNPGSVALGPTGTYTSPSAAIKDPFRNIPQPSVPAPPTVGVTGVDISSPTDGCVYSTCREYYPGLYVGGLNVTGGNPVIFRPGLYYMQGGGFTLKNVVGGGGATDYNALCVGCAADPDTGLGMVVYDTGPAGSTFGNNPTGGFDINTNVSATLSGSTKTTFNSKGEIVPAAPYYGMLFWEDRTADKHVGSGPVAKGRSHSLGQGNGCFTLLGTIYATNTDEVMTLDPTHYQELTYNGTPCSTTVQQGFIVASSLQIVGATTIKMKLNPFGFLDVRQVALIGGGPHP